MDLEKSIVSRPSLSIKLKEVDYIEATVGDFDDIFFTDDDSALIMSDAPIIKKLKHGSRVLVALEEGKYKMICGPIRDDELYVYP